MKQIDIITTYDTEDKLLWHLKRIQPEVRFLGDDYKNKSFTGDNLNIPIHWVDRDHGWSTTKFKTLIAKQIENERVS